MKAPKAPDPVATANAQKGLNKETAITQQQTGLVNQRGPDGSLVYNTTGTWPDGTPKYEAVTTLSPEQQQLYNLNNQTEQNLGNIGVQQSEKVGNILNTPMTIGNEATEARLMELGSKRLDPRFARDREALRTQLINQGFNIGDEGYKTAMSDFGETENDAYNQLLLQGRGQAVQEQLTERNQPLNEISALMSGSQVSQPNFTATSQTPVAGVDYMGMVNSNYAAKSAAHGAMMGGLFGLGGTAATAAMKYSDRRMKRDIERVGRLDNGLPVYLFKYKGEDGLHMGLIADEVKELHPEAIMRIGGYDAVRYDIAVR